MGVHTAEVLCNVGLCCLKTQQFDLVWPCLEDALSLSLAKDASATADVWYNSGHAALAVGEFDAAAICWRLALSARADHAEACNNLAVLALLAGRDREGRALLKVSNKSHTENLFFLNKYFRLN